MVADEVVLSVEEEGPDSCVQQRPQLFRNPEPVPPETDCHTSTEAEGETGGWFVGNLPCVPETEKSSARKMRRKLSSFW